MNYQHLGVYKGSMHGTPRYSGIEYDWEVPDNEVVASPGGVSSTQHHYTKGFYGEGGSSWDQFGNQGQRYPSGVRGNLYAMGYSAVDEQGVFVPPPTDPNYTSGQSTPSVSEAFGYESSDTSRYASAFNPQMAFLRPEAFVGEVETKGATRQSEDFGFDPRSKSWSKPYLIPQGGYADTNVLENELFTPIVGAGPRSRANQSPMEKIPIPEVDVSTREEFQEGEPRRPHIKLALNPYVLFALFVLAYFALDFGSLAAQDWVSSKFFAGKMMWKQYSIIAFALLLALAVVTNLSDTSLLRFEVISGI